MDANFLTLLNKANQSKTKQKNLKVFFGLQDVLILFESASDSTL